MAGEAMRLFTGIHAARGGARGLSAGVHRPQCRVMFTEVSEALGGDGAIQERRAASSWPATKDRSVTEELGSSGYLQRTLPNRAVNVTESGSELPATRYFFDTQAVVKTLEGGGYSRQQAECVARLLSTTLSRSLDPLVAAQVTKTDLELVEVRVAGEVDSLHSKLVLLERSTIATLRHENKELTTQIKKLHEILKEEVRKVQAGMQLDLNLEKSRLKEDSTNLTQRIKDTHNRIETEVAQLKTQIESQKLESIKYLAGGIFSVVTIVLSLMLGLSRLLK